MTVVWGGHWVKELKWRRQRSLKYLDPAVPPS